MKKGELQDWWLSTFNNEADADKFWTSARGMQGITWELKRYPDGGKWTVFTKQNTAEINQQIKDKRKELIKMARRMNGTVFEPRHEIT